jgi:hypothetical protein
MFTLHSLATDYRVSVLNMLQYKVRQRMIDSLVRMLHHTQQGQTFYEFECCSIYEKCPFYSANTLKISLSLYQRV